MKYENPQNTLLDIKKLDRLYFALLCFMRLTKDTPLVGRVTRDKMLYAKLCALSQQAPNDLVDYPKCADAAVEQLDVEWIQLIAAASTARPEFQYRRIDKATGQEDITFAIGRWMDSHAFLEDVKTLYGRTN